MSFLTYSKSNNGVPLKSGLWIIQGHINDSIRQIICDFLSVYSCKYNSILYAIFEFFDVEEDTYREI